ncbi:MAG: hypothetical protein B6245_19115 [Desulfobacteraceae bacterium 4572_88]|nr:MAG: hypothetical protein B6245_19115 [Desulfobacteraceae bacterium 4572_88]
MSGSHIILAGAAAFNNINVFCHANKYAHIGQICVSEGYRHQGIAHTLIKEARQRAKQEWMKRSEDEKIRT